MHFCEDMCQNDFCRATHIHSADYAVERCLSVPPSVRLSHAGILSKRRIWFSEGDWPGQKRAQARPRCTKCKTASPCKTSLKWVNRLLRWPKTIFNDSAILHFNRLMGTLKLHNNGPLYSNTVIGTLAADGWVVTFGTAAPPSPLLAVPNLTAHPSTASVPTSFYTMWHYNYLCTVGLIRARTHSSLIALDHVLMAGS